MEYGKDDEDDEYGLTGLAQGLGQMTVQPVYAYGTEYECAPGAPTPYGWHCTSEGLKMGEPAPAPALLTGYEPILSSIPSPAQARAYTEKMSAFQTAVSRVAPRGAHLERERFYAGGREVLPTPTPPGPTPAMARRNMMLMAGVGLTAAMLFFGGRR